MQWLVRVEALRRRSCNKHPSFKYEMHVKMVDVPVVEPLCCKIDHRLNP